MAVRGACSASLVTSTETPGSAAPDESVMVPAMAPFWRASCALDVTAAPASDRATRTTSIS
jgi:hypothetical protein